MASLTIAQDPSADRVLSQDPFALLTGMLLDQQFPMDRAFAGPAKVLERFGTLDPAAIAAADPEAFADLCATPPAVHRYGRSMAGRIQALAVVVRDEYDGDASAIWSTATTGNELFARLKALPGFGEQKAKIFTALLGKQLAVRPDGWQEVCGAYAEPGSFRSVADVVDAESLQKVRGPMAGPDDTAPTADAGRPASDIVCASCGATPDGAEALSLARITWARGVENGRDTWTCEQCSRRFLRSIEGKLDSSWW